MKREPIEKDEKYYRERETEGYRKTAAGKSQVQLQRAWDRRIARLPHSRPYVDPDSGIVMWGTAVEKGGKKS